MGRGPEPPHRVGGTLTHPVHTQRGAGPGRGEEEGRHVLAGGGGIGGPASEAEQRPAADEGGALAAAGEVLLGDHRQQRGSLGRRAAWEGQPC